ncbi:MAG: hypothetical protein ACE5HI_02580 [bacterium]
MGWLFSKGKRTPEEFTNQGTTKREKQVAQLLNGKMRVRIVESVRFANWSLEGPDSLIVSVDLVGGRTVPGGYVKRGMTAKEQAEEIYQNINAMLRIGGI